MPTCTVAVDNMHCEMPPTIHPEMWSAQLYAQVYGLAQPAAQAAAAAATTSSNGNSSRSGSSNVAAAPASRVTGRPPKSRGLEAAFAAMSLATSQNQPLTKTQKRNAKRREKQKQEKAAALAASAEEAAAA